MTDINTPEHTLEETQALLHHEGFDATTGAAVYTFDAEGSQDEPFPQSVTLSSQAWLEFGRPDIVTVNVRAGDHLSTRSARPAGWVATVGRLLGYLTGSVVVAIVGGAAIAVILGLVVLLQHLTRLVALG